MRRAVLAMLTICLLLLLPAVAVARRGASGKEHSALVAAAVTAGDLSKSQGRCTRGFISTVNGNYGSLGFIPDTTWPKTSTCASTGKWMIL